MSFHCLDGFLETNFRLLLLQNQSVAAAWFGRIRILMLPAASFHQVVTLTHFQHGLLGFDALAKELH